ncbi:hypothetical protein SAMN05216474_0771 [Lishizhenia tianjinensis]|uniref:Uncharacterized protein n=1 Tax=Lishizhenia tianjinensis TaxID=477690 RepID=A0A1I6YAV7_9FLAO|nr:hypothetical protein [Lishizhenia tianjinensis]SFT47623.1 hypothetical protein SAMN05216474_0771 [Lishizhenia tianjinensis]
MKLNFIDATLDRLKEPLAIITTKHDIIEFLKLQKLKCKYYLNAEIELNQESALIKQLSKCNVKHPFFKNSLCNNRLPIENLGKNYSILINEVKLINKKIDLHGFELNNQVLNCELSYLEEWQNVPENELHFYYAQVHIKNSYLSIKRIVDQIMVNTNLDHQQTKKLISQLYLKINSSLQNFKSKFGKSIEESKLQEMEIDDFRFLIQFYIQKLLKHIELNYQTVLDHTVPIPMRSQLRNTCELLEKQNEILQRTLSLSSEIISLIKLPFEHIKELEACPKFCFSKAYFLINYIEIWHYYSAKQALTDMHALDICMRANLNANQLISYSGEFIKDHLSRIDSFQEKKLELHRYIKTVKQIPIQNKESYIPENKSLKKHILKWLKEELTFVDKVLEQSVTLQIPAPNTPLEVPKEKLNINLTNPEIALFFRLMVETNLIQTSTRTQIFDFITDNLKTETSESLSKANIKNKYYSPEHTSFETVKKALINMLDVLKRDL